MSVHAAALELNVEKTVATSLAELLDRQSLPNVAGKDLGMATPIRKPQALQVRLQNDVSDEVMESVSTAAVVAHDQAVVTAPLVHVGRRREGTVRPAASAASPAGVDGSIVDMTDDVMVDAEGAADQAGVAVPIENERGGRGARGGRGELVRVAVIMVTRLEQWL
ncbi:uncharacterized protein KRP23_3980 [Phytophthora ramorum]|uniref:uncharacterized protein n=1 Tax=Phytophthora ramorum TaxID=164328 RepID=UPI00309D0569|nr:hypothetical protein KRP23_3980 [Phytophthora ramorum]